jgi:hypothetical protein
VELGDAKAFLAELHKILDEHQTAWTKLRLRGDVTPEG